jgi:hypothetical protein
LPESRKNSQTDECNIDEGCVDEQVADSHIALPAVASASSLSESETNVLCSRITDQEKKRHKSGSGLICPNHQALNAESSGSSLSLPQNPPPAASKYKRNLIGHNTPNHRNHEKAESDGTPVTAHLGISTNLEHEVEPTTILSNPQIFDHGSTHNDSGYASMTSKRVGKTSKASSDGEDNSGMDDKTRYSTESNTLSLRERQYISELAEDLLREMPSSSPNYYALNRVFTILPNLLVSFAHKLVCPRQAKMSRDASLFVTKYRRLVVNLLAKSKRNRESNRQNLIASSIIGK